jgi:hypothetical protein
VKSAKETELSLKESLEKALRRPSEGGTQDATSAKLKKSLEISESVLEDEKKIIASQNERIKEF